MYANIENITHLKMTSERSKHRDFFVLVFISKLISIKKLPVLIKVYRKTEHYMVTWRYDISLLMSENISNHSFAALPWEIFFITRREMS